MGHSWDFMPMIREGLDLLRSDMSTQRLFGFVILTRVAVVIPLLTAKIDAENTKQDQTHGPFGTHMFEKNICRDIVILFQTTFVLLNVILCTGTKHIDDMSRVHVFAKDSCGFGASLI